VTPTDMGSVTKSYLDWSISEIVRDMKEEILYVSEEVVDERACENLRPISYELPDGKSVELKGERIKILEKFFQPNDMLPGFSGVHQMVVESVTKAEIDIRRDLFQNIILSGGNTHFKGFMDRLMRLIPDISPNNVKVKVTGSAERKHSAWIGGSILSSLGSFQQMWMSKQEYEEHGSIMVERKCA